MDAVHTLSNTCWLLTATSRETSNSHLNKLKNVTLEFLEEHAIPYEEIPPTSKYTWTIRYNNLKDAQQVIAVLVRHHTFLHERANASSEVFLSPESTNPELQNMAIKIGARPPTSDNFKTFDEVYFKQYLPDHSQPATRWAHIIPTVLTTATVAYNVWNGNWGSAFTSLACGTALIYECGFHSHLFIEKNIPSTIKYPLYSACSELKMTWNTLTNFVTGAMDRDLVIAGITKPRD